MVIRDQLADCKGINAAQAHGAEKDIPAKAQKSWSISGVLGVILLWSKLTNQCFFIKKVISTLFI
jgi:hypothetical protein